MKLSVNLLKIFAKINFKPWCTRVFLFLLVLLLLSSAIINIALPNRVLAKPGASSSGTQDPVEEASVYQATVLLTTCVAGTGLSGGSGLRAKGITKSDLANGKFINKSAVGNIPLGPINTWGSRVISHDGEISIGYMVKGNDNGTLNCQEPNDIKKAMDTLGMSNSELLVDSGVYKLSDDKTHYVPGDSDKSKSAEKLLDAVQKKYTQISFGEKASKAAQYFNLKESFLKGCSGGEEGSGVPVEIVDSSGKQSTKNYVYKNGKDDFSKVGFGMEGDGSNDGKMQCDYIVKRMKELAPDAVSRVNNVLKNGGTVSETGGDGEAGPPVCETSGFNLSWFVCPFITGLAETSDKVYNEIIQPLLVARDVGYLDPSENLYKIWNSFRVIANIFLVIGLLVIVFGQTIGGGMVDAYTAKKSLPRILIAAIMINISVYVVAFMLDVSNIAGQGINSILLAPFGDTGNSIIKLSSGGTAMITLSLGAGIGALFAAGGGFGGALLLVLMAVVIVVLAFLAVLVTLVVRQGLIILLVLISPLAFALYVLPNTEQYFKKWWGLLFKTLLVYPIVMCILGVSYMLSIVLSGSFPNAVQWVADLVSILLMVIPLFLVPFAFKMAGGLTGQLFGMLSNNPLSNLAKGGLKGQSKKGFAKTGQNFKNAELFKGRNTGLRGSINRGAGLIGNVGSSGFGRKGWVERSRAQSRKAILAAAAAGAESDGGYSAGNDDVTELAAMGLSADDIIEQLKDKNNIVTGANYTAEEAKIAVAELEASFGLRTGSAAMRVAAYKAWAASSTGVGTKDEDKQKAIDLAHSLVESGVMSTQDAAGAFKANRSRADVNGPGYASMMSMIQSGSATDSDGNTWNQQAFAGSKASDVIGSHANTAEAFADTAIENLEAAKRSGNQAEKDRAAAALSNLHSSSSSMSPKQAARIAAALSQESETDGPSWREVIERARRNPADHPVFHDTVREYGSDPSTRGGTAITAPPED